MMRSSFDEITESTTREGPTPGAVEHQAASPIEGRTSPAGSIGRRKTVAWSENGNDGDDATQVDNKNESRRPAARARGSSASSSSPKKSVHKLALFVILIQAAWALIIPVKNIATVTYPTMRPDADKTQSLPYRYTDPSSDVVFANMSSMTIPGTSVRPLLSDVLDVVLGNDLVRQELLHLGTFDIDAILKLLSLSDFVTLSTYYALVHQSSEFPGGTYTPRSFHVDEASPERLVVLLRDSSTSEVRDIPIELKCSSATMLEATKCTRTVDTQPCDGTETSADDRKLEDVDLRALAPGTGLENNIALLYVVEFFHQALSTVLSTQNWAMALEDLRYNQTVSDALNLGTASVYKDNSPYLLDRDAFLVGIQAAQMETLQLDSCLAAELTVGTFYVRSFVLDLIQRGLVRYGLFDGDVAAIHVPTTTEAILKPVFAFDIKLTSGARPAPRVQQIRSMFLKHIHVATQTRFAAQFKLDRRAMNAAQATGSSMRILQTMAFYPDLVSLFTTSTVENSHDVQHYKLLGWVGSDLPVFKDSFTAHSMMVYHLAEQTRTAQMMIPMDRWWDDEQRHASWFRALEATPLAPFKVLDTHLSITSTLRTPAVDDDDSTRCQRALFKVLTKVVYLALLEKTKPANYLMFMGDVATGAKTWLLSRIYSEELMAESFSGERIAFPYRNGPSQRKDDGSAWVVVPLLEGMIAFYGKDATATMILQEMDTSLRLFLKASNGDLHFPDTASCRVSGTTGTPMEVTDSDSVDAIYDKIAPGLQAATLDLLERIPTLVTMLKTAIGSLVSETNDKNVHAYTGYQPLTKEQVVGSSVITNSTEGRGPPGVWVPRALTVGLRKLWPAKTPTSEVIKRVRDATVCYRMLDTRDWSTTTRCFAEPNNAVILRTELRSEQMRKFFLSNWSMAVMLNTMAGVVVLKYIRKLLKAWRITHFECLDVEVALQLNFQGMGVLSISQSLLLLVASIPALIGMHIPADPLLLPFYLQSEKLPKVSTDILVTLSMTWFLKLGFDVCNGLVNPRRPVDWYYLFRVRAFMIFVILIARLISPQGIMNESYLMWKLVLTCLFSLLLGAASTVVIFLPERRGKVVDGARKENHDGVVAALVKQNLPLHRYGVLGRTSKGWSKTGLIVEGWRLAQTADGGEVLRKDGGEILLPRTDDIPDDKVDTSKPTTL